MNLSIQDTSRPQVGLRISQMSCLNTDQKIWRLVQVAMVKRYPVYAFSAMKVTDFFEE